MATKASSSASMVALTTSATITTPLIDIAVNLSDCVFVGMDWKGKQVHPNDFDYMMKRAQRNNVKKCLVSGTSLVQCARAIKLCRTYPGQLYCTVGVHPANSSEFLVPITAEERQFVEVNGGLLPSLVTSSPTSTADAVSSSSTSASAITPYTIGGPLKYDKIEPTTYRTQWEASPNTSNPHAEERLALLEQLIEKNRDVVAAVGECGMDGAELEYCPYDVQAFYFKRQLELSQKLKLPLFLHSRDCGMRFVDVIAPFVKEVEASAAAKASEGGATANTAADSYYPVAGVVHSFTGDDEELTALLGMNLYIGLNGSAFRTEESAKRSCTAIPLDRLMLETDAPWCDIRKDNYGAKYIETSFPTVKKEKLRAAMLSAEELLVGSELKEGETAADAKPTFTPAPCVDRRNEPCFMVNVLECYVGCKAEFEAHQKATVEGGTTTANFKAAVAKQVYDNTVAVFPLLA